jgi:hypothetical protein
MFAVKIGRRAASLTAAYLSVSNWRTAPSAATLAVSPDGSPFLLDATLAEMPGRNGYFPP